MAARVTHVADTAGKFVPSIDAGSDFCLNYNTTTKVRLPRWTCPEGCTVFDSSEPWNPVAPSGAVRCINETAKDKRKPTESDTCRYTTAGLNVVRNATRAECKQRCLDGTWPGCRGFEVELAAAALGLAAVSKWHNSSFRGAPCIWSSEGGRFAFPNPSWTLQAGINGQEAAAPTRWDEYSRRGKFVANVGAGAASPMLFVRRPNAANGSKADADKVTDPATQNLIACCYRGLTAANAGGTCEGNTATPGGCANCTNLTAARRMLEASARHMYAPALYQLATVGRDLGDPAATWQARLEAAARGGEPFAQYTWGQVLQTRAHAAEAACPARAGEARGWFAASRTNALNSVVGKHVAKAARSNCQTLVNSTCRVPPSNFSQAYAACQRASLNATAAAKTPLPPCALMPGQGGRPTRGSLCGGLGEPAQVPHDPDDPLPYPVCGCKCDSGAFYVRGTCVPGNDTTTSTSTTTTKTTVNTTTVTTTTMTTTTTTMTTTTTTTLNYDTCQRAYGTQAEAGDAAYQNRLACCYRGVWAKDPAYAACPPDPVRCSKQCGRNSPAALPWIRNAAAQLYAPALYQMGTYTYYGYGGANKSRHDAYNKYVIPVDKFCLTSQSGVVRARARMCVCVCGCVCVVVAAVVLVVGVVRHPGIACPRPQTPMDMQLWPCQLVAAMLPSAHGAYTCSLLALCCLHPHCARSVRAPIRSNDLKLSICLFRYTVQVFLARCQRRGEGGPVGVGVGVLRLRLRLQSRQASRRRRLLPCPDLPRAWG